MDQDSARVLNETKERKANVDHRPDDSSYALAWACLGLFAAILAGSSDATLKHYIHETSHSGARLTACVISGLAAMVVIPLVVFSSKQSLGEVWSEVSKAWKVHFILVSQTIYSIPSKNTTSFSHFS